MARKSERLILMSKASDNAFFAGTLQRHLKTLPVGKGFYPGAVDEWIGPSTTACWRESVGVAQVQPPIIITPGELPGDLSGMPKPAEFYTLPRETTAAMNTFYGTANKAGSYLTWFSFPCAGIRLYSRTGELVANRVGDELPDHRAHKMVAGRWQAALTEIYLTLGDGEFRRQGWHVYGGAFNYRYKVGGSSLSTHAWGIAFDSNQGENGYKQYSTTFSDVAFDILEKWGFLSAYRAWGHDAMHVQAAVPVIVKGSFYDRNGLPKNIRIAA